MSTTTSVTTTSIINKKMEIPIEKTHSPEYMGYTIPLGTFDTRSNNNTSGNNNNNIYNNTNTTYTNINNPNNTTNDTDINDITPYNPHTPNNYILYQQNQRDRQRETQLLIDNERIRGMCICIMCVGVLIVCYVSYCIYIYMFKIVCDYMFTMFV